MMINQPRSLVAHPPCHKAWRAARTAAAYNPGIRGGEAAMDEAAKKTVLRLFPYGLYAVTATDGAVASGMTANWLTQVSFEPPLVAVAVERDARTLALIRAAGH